MATPILESAFTTGEVSPALFGNVSLTRMHAAAATMRNFFVGYQGGAYSRAGTAFVGFSKQTGRSFPPRLIPFQFSINQGLALEFGNFYMRVIFDGAYVTETAWTITGINNTTPVQVFLSGGPGGNPINGDWLFISGLPQFPQLNNQTFVVNGLGSSAFLSDVYGNPINGAGFPIYAGGGTAARIFTKTTPYSEADLSWLKFTQSADVMSLCCVNQSTGTEYAPEDLARLASTNWTFTAAVPAPTIVPPINLSLSASTTASTLYQYQVTAISPTDGTESIASVTAQITNAVDVATTAGTITLTWGAQGGATEFNVYKATPVQVPASIAVGVAFGFAGKVFGASFNDSNVVPDFAQLPPIFKNPFARGQITNVIPLTGGSGYTSITTTINTTTGTGAIVSPVVVGGVLTGFIVINGGSGYLPTDTITIGGAGSGATASLVIGPATGTYPATVGYFQERRAYAYTINQPDTYFMSQPGSFTNFDVRIPTIDSDAITGTPWSTQVNGVQFMVPIGGALMVLTGLEAFLLTGSGGSAFTPQPLTPASQSAQNQGFNGCSATVPPIRIYQDVLYVQAKGSTYRDFKFDISNYSYTADDITQNSSHLFNSYTILQHAWCEEPYRTLWAVRSDGVLLSLTWLKSEKIAGWARHDTFGQYVTCCAVTEPPVDALYVGTQRLIGGKTAYVIERFNNRLWNNTEDAWCVDCAFQTVPTQPNVQLGVNTPTGLGGISGVTGLVGGAGYSAGTTISVVDNNGQGPGTGAVLTPTIVGGVITAIVPSVQGQNYTNPAIAISDPAGSAGGSGASATAILNNAAIFATSSPFFTGAHVGQVIRAGGGVATVTSFIDNQHVNANITTPITSIYPDATGTPQMLPQAAGTWTIAPNITTVAGLLPLAGATVTGLADGVKIAPQVVSAAGTITLARPASKVTVGLPFQAQLQSVYIDTGEPTTQGQRKDIPEATARVFQSGPFKMGSNQVDGSTLSPPVVAPQWLNLQAAPVTTKAPYNSVTVPLCTDDIRIPINTGTAKHGQVCVEQDDPYPLNILAFVPEVLLGDTPSQNWPEKQQKR